MIAFSKKNIFFLFLIFNIFLKADDENNLNLKTSDTQEISQNRKEDIQKTSENSEDGKKEEKPKVFIFIPKNILEFYFFTGLKIKNFLNFDFQIELAIKDLNITEKMKAFCLNHKIASTVVAGSILSLIIYKIIASIECAKEHKKGK